LFDVAKIRKKCKTTPTKTNKKVGKIGIFTIFPTKYLLFAKPVDARSGELNIPGNRL
jgi:hypothetical protein